MRQMSRDTFDSSKTHLVVGVLRSCWLQGLTQLDLLEVFCWTPCCYLKSATSIDCLYNTHTNIKRVEVRRARLFGGSIKLVCMFGIMFGVILVCNFVEQMNKVRIVKDRYFTSLKSLCGSQSD